MINATDISVIFNPSTIQGSRSLGYGQVNILGIMISYTVFPSNFGLGFMVSFPSKPSIKNGVQELDANGKPKYFKEVYIQNIELRNMIDAAVQNAMANKGVYVGQAAQQAYQAGVVVHQQTQAPQTNNSFQNPSFTQPSNSFTPPVQQVQQATPASYQQPVSMPSVLQQQPVQPATLTPANFAGSSLNLDDDLPF